MEHPGADEIYELLARLERRARTHARGIPEQLEIKATWSGIGFRVGTARLVAPLGVIREILKYPALTRVPGAKPWVKGIANVRGNLLPVIDLHGFLNDEVTPPRRSVRVLVVGRAGATAGLVVDEVLGMRQFFEEEFTADTAAMPAHVRPYAIGVYQRGEDCWGVVDLNALASGDAFIHVAA